MGEEKKIFSNQITYYKENPCSKKEGYYYKGYQRIFIQLKSRTLQFIWYNFKMIIIFYHKFLWLQLSLGQNLKKSNKILMHFQDYDVVLTVT